MDLKDCQEKGHKEKPQLIKSSVCSRKINSDLTYRQKVSHKHVVICLFTQATVSSSNDKLKQQ